MTRNELISKLIQESHFEVNRHSCLFSSEADAQLREMVTTGVERMTDAELNDNAKVVEVEHNLRYFCTKICAQTRRENRGIIENRTFTKTRMIICPIWPFC